MLIRAVKSMVENGNRVWRGKLYWALPLFFLVKGLLWLTIPIVSAYYVLN